MPAPEDAAAFFVLSDSLACPASVEAAVSRLSGVSYVEVSLERAEAVVRYDPARITPADIVAIINRHGFQALLVTNTPGGEPSVRP